MTREDLWGKVVRGALFPQDPTPQLLTCGAQPLSTAMRLAKATELADDVLKEFDKRFALRSSMAAIPTFRETTTTQGEPVVVGESQLIAVAGGTGSGVG
jgi:hypothetical protein